jgi:hypothetical protein
MRYEQQTLGNVPSLNLGDICHAFGSGHLQEGKAFQGKGHGKVGCGRARTAGEPLHFL